MARTAKRTPSTREKQVLQSLAAGLSMPSIARELGISLRTTECHVVGAKNKLACSSTQALIALAIQCGFISTTHCISGDQRLTPREVQCLRLACHGASMPSIASELGIALPTVEAHMAKVRLKTKSRNVFSLVAKAVQSGLVTVDLQKLEER